MPRTYVPHPDPTSPRYDEYGIKETQGGYDWSERSLDPEYIAGLNGAYDSDEPYDDDDDDDQARYYDEEELGSDLQSWALGQVNWREIVTHWLEDDLKDDEDEEEDEDDE